MRPREDGAFEFINVPPGQYVLRASHEICSIDVRTSGNVPLPEHFQSFRGLADVDGLRLGFVTQARLERDQTGREIRRTPDSTWWAEQSVSVPSGEPARDIEGLSLVLRPTINLSGAVSGPADISSVTVSLDPVGGSLSQGRAWATISMKEPAFTLAGLMPAQYWVRVKAGAFAIRSVKWNGVDYTERPIDLAAAASAGPLEISLDRGGRVTGQVTDGAGRPTAAPVVIVFPPNPTEWVAFGFNSPRLVRVLPNSLGRYLVAGLPAGDYLVAAVEIDDSLVGDWQAPSFLQRLAGLASKAKLSWGQDVTVDLKVIPGK